MSYIQILSSPDGSHPCFHLKLLAFRLGGVIVTHSLKDDVTGLIHLPVYESVTCNRVTLSVKEDIFTKLCGEINPGQIM